MHKYDLNLILEFFFLRLSMNYYIIVLNQQKEQIRCFFKSHLRMAHVLRVEILVLMSLY